MLKIPIMSSRVACNFSGGEIVQCTAQFLGADQLMAVIEDFSAGRDIKVDQLIVGVADFLSGVTPWYYVFRVARVTNCLYEAC